MSSDAREFDLVLFGATGFTGGLVARHVAAHASGELRVALAGRRAEALHALRDRLRGECPGRAALGVVVADVREPASLGRMAACTRAVLSTAGPFIEYGEPVVSACIAHGTDYLDSTGEQAFVLKMIERYDAAARERAVRLIFACGFESVPADLGVYYTVQQLPQGEPIDIVSYLAFRGVFSGGTERSAIKELAAAQPPDSAYAFDREGRQGCIVRGRVQRAAAVRAWATPFFETVDSHLVLRSAAALERYGPRFTYTPMVVYPNLFVMLGLMGAMGSAAALGRSARLRGLMLKLVKPSGRGPTQKQMDAGWFRLRLVGRSQQTRVTTEVRGGDPGYGATSMMLGQSALCLLEDAAQLPACSGVVTTAQVFGDRLIARLRAHGMEFRVVPEGE